MSTHEYTATLIPGDGIGPEVTDAALEVAAASGVTIRWERVEAGADVFQKYGTPLPDSVLNAVRRRRHVHPRRSAHTTGYREPDLLGGTDDRALPRGRCRRLVLRTCET